MIDDSFESSAISSNVEVFDEKGLTDSTQKPVSKLRQATYSADLSLASARSA